MFANENGHFLGPKIRRAAVALDTPIALRYKVNGRLRGRP
jgi:hypothetical protein